MVLKTLCLKQDVMMPLFPLERELPTWISTQGILVNAEIINPENEYLVATTSRFADGEGPFSALWNPVRRQDYEVSMNELLIEHFRRESDLYNITDARIRS